MERRALRRVVVVFKTHFDLGFTDLPDRVMALNTGPMFESVREVMRATEGEPPGLRYRWTLPAWPMRFLLRSHAVAEETRAEARRLVEDGRLVWHAWPFTTHTAFCGLEDLVRGLHISRSLSEEFGYWPLSAKQTDVPGHTWILPSLLVRAGVRFLHLGCNPGSHAPHVPRLFWWEGPDGSRLLTFYSAGGYGTSLLPPDDWAPDTWLALQHTVDNVGPQSADELGLMRAQLAERAPDGELVVGKLDDFYDSVIQRPEQLADLPVVPYDLADTWIHGVGTMPREVARVRALRARLLAVESEAAMREWPGKSAKADLALARQIAPHVDAAYEELMLFGEHTWGLDVKSTIRRVFGPGFEAARQTEPYKRLEASWDAKAAYVDRAEAALVEAERLVWGGRGEDQARAAVPGVPAATQPESDALESRWLRLRVDPAGGGIASLLDKQTGREWVDDGRGEPFGGYRYDLYSARDIAEFMRAYGLYLQDWFVRDFGKAGYPEDTGHLTAWARGFTLRRVGEDTLRIEGGRLRPGENATVASQASMPDQGISIEISLPDSGPYVDLEYRIEGKAATPLAESAVVSFPLNLPKPSFRLGQVGSVIDPGRDIVAGANRSLWCVDGWVDAADDRVGLGVIPLDMPLVSLGSVGIFEFDPDRVPREPVIYSHLFNTQWGTNFRQWHEGDFSFRVRLVPHAGEWRTARLWEVARQTMGLADTGGSQDAARPVRLSDGLALLALRPRHDGGGLIVRFWDALGLARLGQIELDGPVSAVWRCDLMERPSEQLATDMMSGQGVRLRFSVAPHAVETLLVEFAK